MDYSCYSDAQFKLVAVLFKHSEESKSASCESPTSLTILLTVCACVLFTLLGGPPESLECL